MATILLDTLRIPFCIFDLIKIVAIFLGEIIMKAIERIQSLIISLPGRPDGMLAQDLAKIYHVKTGHLNQAVKRNKNKFPEDFMFQVTKEEQKLLISQKLISQKAQTAKPYIFTGEGAILVGSLIRSGVCTQVEQIAQAFEILNFQTINTRSEYDFEKDVINNLFSGFKIIPQFPVFDGKYRIDWYIPELKLAIEFDELHHWYFIKEDEKRQKEIEVELGCRFIRYTV